MRIQLLFTEYMGFSDELLEEGTEIWAAQFDHPFVTELADGELDEQVFRHWIKQNYQYLPDYARIYALAGTKARRESTMQTFLDTADTILNEEMDLHRSFAADYGVSRKQLEAAEMSPTCVAYTNHLIRTAYDRPLPVIAASLFPCMQGFLDIAEYMNDRAEREHKYTPFIDLYTGEEFRTATADLRATIDELGDRHPGYHDEMRKSFRTSARLEHQFWEMAYTLETWEL